MIRRSCRISLTQERGPYVLASTGAGQRTMNIDLLPFSAFALESCRTAASARGDNHTLTLQLALAPVSSSYDATNDIASASQALACAAPLRAAVLPADGSELTITF